MGFTGDFFSGARPESAGLLTSTTRDNQESLVKIMQKDDCHQSYHRYWGKAMPQSNGPENGPRCHLLPYHSLDVAAVGHVLLSEETSRNRSLAGYLGIEPTELQAVFTFFLTIHDIGKFARAFQSLAAPAPELLVEPDPHLPYRLRHDALGMLLWKQCFSRSSEFSKAWSWPTGTAMERQHKRSLETFLNITFGHHGKPVDAGSEALADHFYPEDEEAAWAFARDCAALVAPQWPCELMGDKEWGKTLKRLSWHLAGQAVLADWIGSDQSVFTYKEDPVPLEDYWNETALPKAFETIHRIGLNHSSTPAPFKGFETFYGFPPTPLQNWAEETAIETPSNLFILEDVTGAGKTEAALTLAHRLIERGYVEGAYFGLPTMATSNAMYSRIADIYPRWFSENDSPSLVLAHSARHLNESFAASLEQQQRDTQYGIGEQTGSASCNQWFADSRKKALLADIGVGTIDQALMAVLPFRHQSLRLAGLANKVLIVDEIHACDDYMLTLLGAVLEAHAKQGGSAILLTATLPIEMREKLISAWNKGLGEHEQPELNNHNFPLASQVSRNGITESPVKTRKSVQRHVLTQRLDSTGEVLAILRETMEQGGCACWIRNTVDDAIAAAQWLWESVADPSRVILFHSRFIMADRQSIEEKALTHFGKDSNATDRRGYILIATQVIEQSLDLDFDCMISDLAPIDLLIQRAGRLHRHSRTLKGDRCQQPDAKDKRPTPVLHIHAPPPQTNAEKDWIRRFLPGTAAVYRNHGQLWLSLNVLEERGEIRMPEEARHLIETVYGPEADTQIPEALADSFFEQEGERQSQVTMGHFNRLNLDKGYTTASANGWQEEIDIGTRLSDEPSVTVTLVRLNEAGTALKPWADTANHPWEMSQLRIRQSLAKQLPEVSTETDELWETTVAQKPGLKFSRPWFVEQKADSLSYNQRLGLYRQSALSIEDKT